jgi:hypothetical protein
VLSVHATSHATDINQQVIEILPMCTVPLLYQLQELHLRIVRVTLMLGTVTLLVSERESLGNSTKYSRVVRSLGISVAKALVPVSCPTSGHALSLRNENVVMSHFLEVPASTNVTAGSRIFYKEERNVHLCWKVHRKRSLWRVTIFFPQSIHGFRLIKRVIFVMEKNAFCLKQRRDF